MNDAMPRRLRCNARRWITMATITVAAMLMVPNGASAHGGIGVAQGGGRGVQIAVQGSEAGSAQVDLATNLTGPGTGQGSKVVYWVRPKGRSRSVRVSTDRDASGIHHAEIPTTGRGSWQDWDVSAYVTLNTGKRLRVTNDKSDPPGPPTARVSRPAPETSTSAAAPSVGAPAERRVASEIEDVSGEGNGAPSWVIPSLVAVAVLSVAAVGVARSRRGRREDE